MTTAKNSLGRGGMVWNAIHLGLGQIATTILTLLLSAITARTLGASDFGLLYLITSIASFAYVVVDWGHGSYIIRETARHPARSGELLGSAMAARVAVALIAAVIAVAVTWLLGYDMRTRVLTGGLILGWLPQYLGLSFGWVFRGIERMDRDALLNVVLKLATLVCSYVCFLMSGLLLGLVIAWSLAGCLTLVIGFGMYRRLKLPKISATMPTIHELLHGGASLLAMSLATAVTPFFNANILYSMTSHTVVGWFGAASNIMGTLIAPAGILGMIMYPRLSKLADDAVEFKRAFGISLRLILLLSVLGGVGTYLFAEVPIAVIYSMDKFGPSVDVLRAFAMVVMLLYIDVFLGGAAIAAGKAGRLAIAKVASVIVSVVSGFILVPLCESRYANGGLGVAYATLIGELLMVVSSFILIREAVDRSAFRDLCSSLSAGAITLVLFRLLPAFTPFCAIPMCVLVFTGISLLIGALKRTDLELLIAGFRKPSPLRR